MIDDLALITVILTIIKLGSYLKEKAVKKA